MKYESIIRAFQDKPWAILESKLAEIQAFLEVKAAGEEIPKGAIIKAENLPKPYMVGKIAVIPIRGTIVPRANMLTNYSGGVSAEMLKAQIRMATLDDEVEAILLDIDSPGGNVYGIREAADEILRAREIKPVVAHANPMAASAAYWLAASASEVVVTPSGDIGSIGVIMVHRDQSGWEAKEGVKTTVIRAGKYKGEGNPWEPLSEDALARAQDVAEQSYEDFVAGVAAGRRLPKRTILSDFGEGRLMTAKEGLERKMVDRIEAIDETLGRLSTKRNRTAAMRRRSDLTVREFEAGIRELFGFTAAQAKQIAEEGFRVVDSPGETTKEIAELRDEAAAEGAESPGETVSVGDELGIEVGRGLVDLIRASRR